MTEFRKNKKFTKEEKEEIISHAKENGLTSVKTKFNVWPETVRYWMMSSEDKKHLSKSGKERYKNKKKDPEYNKRCIEYRQYRQESGIARAKWIEWRNTLSDEEIRLRIASIKQHRLDNIKHYKKKARERYLKEKEAGLHRKKYNEDPLHKLKCNIREHVRQAVKYSNVAKEHPSIKYLGCSVEEFKAHIESQFVEGMSWDNHSRGEECWHLDHIKPLATLKDISDIDALKEICHYTNYQPLWEKDNLTKQDKYEER